MLIRNAAKKVFPAYDLIVQEKKKRYPDPEAYNVDETLAEVKLQALVDQTSERLSDYLKEVLETLNDEEKKICN